ncbi:hypothetical protein [Cognatishimia sp. MH4019]|uniref:hypothetical protein n=1 Tax=Cognatishimia sp. MH4019 TaxID=2854030 RepID=UPI001CD28B13|nr:hypothetical protein [Cognatishimia sp. MH4019]
MSNSNDQPQIVVVYSDGSSYPTADTVKQLSDRGLLGGQKVEHSSAQTFRLENVSAQLSDKFPHAAHNEILGRGASMPAYDPHQVHREFPDRWQAYIRANYRNLNHVQLIFGVSERTARKWWKGETGANGGHVAIAVNEHPVAAPRMLFAAE